MKIIRRRLLTLVFAVAAFPAFAGMVPTPHTDEAELQKALREALPGNLERAERLAGQHAGAIKNILSASNTFAIVGYAILLGIIAFVAILGVIAIIGYGFTKKEKKDERLGPP